MKPAVFLDRDGTTIEQVHHLTDPRDVALIPGSAGAIVSLRARGYACVVVTNQSVIGRGMLDEADLAKVHAEMNRQLAAAGTEVDAIYFCPVAPAQKDQTVVEHPDRKPGPGMLIRAAREHSLDLAASWMVGDNISDVLSGRNAGCRASILVRTGHGERFAEREDCYDYLVDDLGSAARLILKTDLGEG
jgi:histidinol-phosphate phosphatase family protein